MFSFDDVIMKKSAIAKEKYNMCFPFDWNMFPDSIHVSYRTHIPYMQGNGHESISFSLNKRAIKYFFGNLNEWSW